MLEIHDVGRTYANGVIALGGVGLDVAAGEIVALLGGSGCGKSTLLRLVSGLDHADTGRISVDGTVIEAPHPAVGIVFQEARLLPWLTVADNVGFGLAHLPAAERRERILATLAKVGLADYGPRWPRELSGGQAQRVSIARALAARPSVLLLDEPFSALDAFTRQDLQDHLLELWTETGPTLLVVTHDVEEAVTLADRIAIMRPRPGRIETIVTVDLARPRDRLSPAFEATKRTVLLHLDASLRRRPSGEETAPAAAI